MLVHFRLSDLNPQQREAVITTEGPLLILAGAGSGKTRVITYRIAHLLSQGVPASQILAVSFTNKAADEMKERVERLVGSRLARSLILSTFHSLGLLILKAEKEALGFPKGFTIYDTADQLGVIRDILKDAQVADRRIDPKAVLSRISRLKNAGTSPEEFLKQLHLLKYVSEYDGFAAEIYPRYQAKMRAFHALDFDDLLVETLRLFRENEAICKRWQNRFQYVMVDEYQDTNRCQFEFLQLLCKTHQNLAVVGDDDQSIYGFRGAYSENILNFGKEYQQAKIITLEENYRSTQVILDAANAVIAKNQNRHPKKLWSQKKEGDKIQLVVCPDAESEAQFVASEIELLKAHHKKDLRDIAILYRSNVQARLLEEELRQARIQYRMIGGQAFFDRKEIKDAIAYLKTLLYPRDEISLRRIINYPARGIGPNTISILEELHKQLLKKNSKAALWDVLSLLKQGEFPDSLPKPGRAAVIAFFELMEKYHLQLRQSHDYASHAKLLFVEAGIHDDLLRSGPTAAAATRRLKNLDGFVESLRRFQSREEATGPDTLSNYLHRLSLQSQDDDSDSSTDDILTLSTLHGAKGLEYQVVFLVGVEEELLPHKRILNPTEIDMSEVSGATDITEERRLFYVGITRARQQLYLTRAELRGNRNAPRIPSRFLDELPKDSFQIRDIASSGTGMSHEEEQALIREQIAKLLKMTA